MFPWKHKQPEVASAPPRPQPKSPVTRGDFGLITTPPKCCPHCGMEVK